MPNSPSKLGICALQRGVCVVAALTHNYAAVALLINLMACPADAIKGGVHADDTWSVVYCVR